MIPDKGDAWVARARTSARSARGARDACGALEIVHQRLAQRGARRDPALPSVPARGDLALCRRLVDPALAARLPREVLDGVGEVDSCGVDGGLRERLGEQAAGGTREGFAGTILLVAGLARRPASSAPRAARAPARPAWRAPTGAQRRQPSNSPLAGSACAVSSSSAGRGIGERSEEAPETMDGRRQGTVPVNRIAPASVARSAASGDRARCARRASPTNGVAAGGDVHRLRLREARSLRRSADERGLPGPAAPARSRGPVSSREPGGKAFPPGPAANSAGRAPARGARRASGRVLAWNLAEWRGRRESSRERHDRSWIRWC